MACKFYELIHSHDKDWILQKFDKTFFPDIALYNSILEINGSKAKLLETMEILKLVSTLTNDENTKWVFIHDINMFKKIVETNFSNVLLPALEKTKWGVFVINDAILSDKQHNELNKSNQYTGNHWITVAVEMEL